MKNHPPRKKDKSKTLSYAQAEELKWFCQNVIGLRKEYYAALEKIAGLGTKLGRLERTVDLIETFLMEKNNETYLDPQTDHSLRSDPEGPT